MLASCFPINLEKEVTGSIRRDSSGEKFNQNVMIGATNDVFTLNKGLFRKCPCHSQQGNQMYCFHFTRHAQCVIKNLFPFSPLRGSHATRLGTPINYNPIAWHALARGKVAHNLYSPGTEIACAQQSIPYRKEYEPLGSVCQWLFLHPLQRSLATFPAVDKKNHDVIA